MGDEFLKICERINDKGEAGEAQKNNAEGLQLAPEQIAVDQH